jgi:hypothetical protein
LTYSRDLDGATAITLSHAETVLAVIQAGGALTETMLSAREYVGLSPPHCSDGSDPCPNLGHDLEFRDGNAPYPIPVETVDEVAGWRFAPYRLSTLAGHGQCGPAQSQFAILRLRD